jgi:hypothetical protein
MSGLSKGKKWSINFEGLQAFIRSEHPVKTALCVEAATGIPSDTVKKWISGEASPNGRALLTLAMVYGPQVLAACVNGAPKWLDAATRAEIARKLTAEIADRQRELSELTKF